MKKENKFLAYKVFNPDWTCRNFKFEVGKTYKIDGEPELCSRGFHACEKVSNCFHYYDFNPNNKVAVVELSGTILGIGEEKQCANIIKIVKELTWEEMLKLANSGFGNSGNSNSGNWNSGHRNSGHSNSGHRNSGHSNSGDWNSGHRNSGHRNSGDWNSGHSNSGNSNSGHRNSGDWNSGYRNSGDWNSVNKETGFFNSINPKTINVFNKPCDINTWENAQKPNFIYFDLCVWVSFNDMTDEEKIKYPKAFVCDGYLKKLQYKEAWKLSYEKATKKDVELLKELPNFDADVFKEISGIRIN